MNKLELPDTYEEWQLRRRQERMNKTIPKPFSVWVADKEEKESGEKALITFKMFKLHPKIKALVIKTLNEDVAESIVNEGMRVIHKEVWDEIDTELIAHELGVVADTKNGDLPIEYVNFVFTHWQKDYDSRVRIRNLSLLQYLKWWVKRFSLKLKNKYEPEALEL